MDDLKVQCDKLEKRVQIDFEREISELADLDAVYNTGIIIELNDKRGKFLGELTSV